MLKIIICILCLAFYLLKIGNIFLKTFWMYWTLRICRFWKPNHKKKPVYNCKMYRQYKIWRRNFWKRKPIMQCIYTWKTYTHNFHAITFSYENHMTIMRTSCEKVIHVYHAKNIYNWKSCDYHAISMWWACESWQISKNLS